MSHSHVFAKAFESLVTAAKSPDATDADCQEEAASLFRALGDACDPKKKHATMSVGPADTAVIEACAAECTAALAAPPPTEAVVGAFDPTKWFELALALYQLYLKFFGPKP